MQDPDKPIHSNPLRHVECRGRVLELQSFTAVQHEVVAMPTAGA